jgi:excisionase family DNA binding protein
MAAEQQKSLDKAGEAEAPAPAKDKRADYLTARQLAEVLQVSEATIHRLRRAGRIPAVLLTDRLIRFNLRDVQKALRPQTAAHTDSDKEQEPSPQLSFEELYDNFSQ